MSQPTSTVSSRLKDIARESGVSVRTVGRVLAGNGYVRSAVRDRVLKHAKALNYQPNRFAKSLSTQRSYEVTIVMSSIDELHMVQLAGFEQGMRGNGYHVNAMFELDAQQDSKSQQDRILAEIGRRRPDGVAIIRSDPGVTEQLLHVLAESQIPYVLLDGYEEGLDCVTVDRSQGVYEATLYLAAKGYRRIAYLRPSRDPKRLHAYHKARIEGYQRALAQLGREPSFLDAADLEFATMRAIGREVARQAPAARPDAVLAFSDVVAMGFLAGLHDEKVAVPAEVAVMGFDDRRPASMASPPLTTVAQPSYEVGLTAADILLRKMAGQPAPPGGWSRALPMRLVVREST